MSLTASGSHTIFADTDGSADAGFATCPFVVGVGRRRRRRARVRRTPRAPAARRERGRPTTSEIASRARVPTPSRAPPVAPVATRQPLPPVSVPGRADAAGRRGRAPGRGVRDRGTRAAPTRTSACRPRSIPVGQLSTRAGRRHRRERRRSPTSRSTCRPSSGSTASTRRRAGRSPATARPSATTGPPIPPFTCKYFSIGVTALTQGRVRADPVVQRDAQGNVVARSDDSEPSSEQPVLSTDRLRGREAAVAARAAGPSAVDDRGRRARRPRCRARRRARVPLVARPPGRRPGRRSYRTGSTRSRSRRATGRLTPTRRPRVVALGEVARRRARRTRRRRCTSRARRRPRRRASRSRRAAGAAAGTSRRARPRRLAPGPGPRASPPSRAAIDHECRPVSSSAATSNTSAPAANAPASSRSRTARSRSAASSTSSTSSSAAIRRSSARRARPRATKPTRSDSFGFALGPPRPFAHHEPHERTERDPGTEPERDRDLEAREQVGTGRRELRLPQRRQVGRAADERDHEPDEDRAVQRLDAPAPQSDHRRDRDDPHDDRDEGAAEELHDA